MYRLFAALTVLSAMLATSVPGAAAASPQTVKVALLDMTALSAAGDGYGPGIVGRDYGGHGMGHGGGMMGHGMMGRMSIRTNVTSVNAGEVTFDVSNLSRSILHEMLVVSVENPNAPLPYDYNTGEVPEKQIKVSARHTKWHRTPTRRLRSTSSRALTYWSATCQGTMRPGCGQR